MNFTYCFACGNQLKNKPWIDIRIGPECFNKYYCYERIEKGNANPETAFNITNFDTDDEFVAYKARIDSEISKQSVVDDFKNNIFTQQSFKDRIANIEEANKDLAELFVLFKNLDNAIITINESTNGIVKAGNKYILDQIKEEIRIKLNELGRINKYSASVSAELLKLANS